MRAVGTLGVTLFLFMEERLFFQRFVLSKGESDICEEGKSTAEVDKRRIMTDLCYCAFCDDIYSLIALDLIAFKACSGLSWMRQDNSLILVFFSFIPVFVLAQSRVF